MNKQNLLSLNQDALNDFFVCLGEKHYRTKQIMQWIYKVHEFDFDKMFNFSKSLREELNKIACIEFPRVVKQKFALDKVIKWVLGLSKDNYIEMVYIPEKDRGTLCISSQVGCALACTFAQLVCKGLTKISQQLRLLPKY